MNKYYGVIGYKETVETSPGVWTDKIRELEYRGDVLRLNSQTSNSQGVNDNIRISSRISILADPFAIDNFYNIAYIVYLGAKWKVESVEVQYPRLILSLGGLYNE